MLGGIPELAVEVVSPCSATIHRRDDLKQCQAADIEFYWIVDAFLRLIEVWRLVSGKYIAVARAQVEVAVSLPPFPTLSIVMAKLWR